MSQYWISVCCKQNPNTGYQRTWKSRRQLTFYWFTNSAVLIIITGKFLTYYFQDLLPTYLFLTNPFKMYFYTNFRNYFSLNVPYIFQLFCKRTIFFSTKYGTLIKCFWFNLWILGQYNGRHVIKLVNLKSIVKLNDQSSF